MSHAWDIDPHLILGKNTLGGVLQRRTGAEPPKSGSSNPHVRPITQHIFPDILRLIKLGRLRIILEPRDQPVRPLIKGPALRVGADAINDVSAGTEDDGMLALASEMGCGLILMHRERPPDQDQYSDQYTKAPVEGSVTQRVVGGLRDARDRAIGAGIDPGCIMLDPGLGFGKDVEQNLELIETTPELVALGHPVMSALSRKSFVGRVGLGRDSDPSERLPATLALSTIHLRRGARVLRVHDVSAHRQALDAAWALMAHNSTISASESAN